MRVLAQLIQASGCVWGLGCQRISSVPSLDGSLLFLCGRALNNDAITSAGLGNGRAPGNGGSTGVAVHRGPATGGGAPAARPGGAGARASMWSGRARGLQVRGRGYGSGGARGQGRGGNSGRARPRSNGGC